MEAPKEALKEADKNYPLHPSPSLTVPHYRSPSLIKMKPYGERRRSEGYWRPPLSFLASTFLLYSSWWTADPSSVQTALLLLSCSFASSQISSSSIKKKGHDDLKYLRERRKVTMTSHVARRFKFHENGLLFKKINCHLKMNSSKSFIEFEPIIEI